MSPIAPNSNQPVIQPPPIEPVKPATAKPNQTATNEAQPPQQTQQPDTATAPNPVSPPETVAARNAVDRATGREAGLNEQQKQNEQTAELDATKKAVAAEQKRINDEKLGERIASTNDLRRQNLLLNSRKCIEGCHGSGNNRQQNFDLRAFDSFINPKSDADRLRALLQPGAPPNNIAPAQAPKASLEAMERGEFARRALTGSPENAIFEIDKFAANKRLSSADRHQLVQTVADTWRDNGNAAAADKLLIEDASRRLNIETKSQNHTATERAVRALDMTAGLLEKGSGAAAANFLEREVQQAERIAADTPANSAKRRALDAFVENGSARVAMYRAGNPGSYTDAHMRLALGDKHQPQVPGSAFDTAWKLNQVAGKTEQTVAELRKAGHAKEAELLKNIAADSRYQSDATAQGVQSSWSLAGQGMTETYRAIVNKSFDNKIDGASTFGGLFQDRVEKPKWDKARMNTVFHEMQRTIEREQVPMDKAWNRMFNDERELPVGNPLRTAGFGSRKDAAMFLRDHETTRGLLAPFSDLAEAAVAGDARRIDQANGDLVKALQKNDQWDISGQLLKEYQQTARSAEGRRAAGELAGRETGDWLKAKSADFIREELPLLVLSGVASGGVGVGVKGATTALKWGPRAVRAAQVASEIGVAVPLDKMLSSAVNGKKADWSPGGMARDYALAIGGYGLFHALGKGWRAMRGANSADDLMRIGAGNAADDTARHVNRARPNGAGALDNAGDVPFRNTTGWSSKFASDGSHSKLIQQGGEAMPAQTRKRLDELLNRQPNKPLADEIEKIAAEQSEIFKNNDKLFGLPESRLSPEQAAQKQRLQDRLGELQVARDGIDRKINLQADGMDGTALKLMTQFRQSLLGDEKVAREMASKIKIDPSALGKGFTEKELRDFAVDYFRLTGKGFAPDKITLKYTGPRPTAYPDGTINIGDSMSKKMMMHELAHNLEFDNPELYKAARSWVEARAAHSAGGKTETGSLRDLANNDFYKNDGDAFKDHFVDPYVGRIYPQGGMTEAVTVGLQEFADPKSMLKLYRNDPEHFFLIMGALKK